MFSSTESWKQSGRRVIWGKADLWFRHEIARSAEKAYDNLQLDGALKVFLLNSRDELNNFIQQERKNGEQNGIEWRVENNQLRFIRVYFFIELSKFNFV